MMGLASRAQSPGISFGLLGLVEKLVEEIQLAAAQAVFQDNKSVLGKKLTGGVMIALRIETRGRQFTDAAKSLGCVGNIAGQVFLLLEFDRHRYKSLAVKLAPASNNSGIRRLTRRQAQGYSVSYPSKLNVKSIEVLRRSRCTTPEEGQVLSRKPRVEQRDRKIMTQGSNTSSRLKKLSFSEVYAKGS